MLVVTINDQQMAITRTALIHRGRGTTFHPVCLGHGFGRDGVKRKALARGIVHAIAFVPVLKGHGLERLGPPHNGIRHAINIRTPLRDLTTKIRVKTPRATVVDEIDIRWRIGINRGRLNVLIPPVIGGKEGGRIVGQRGPLYRHRRRTDKAKRPIRSTQMHEYQHTRPRVQKTHGLASENEQYAFGLIAIEMTTPMTYRHGTALHPLAASGSLVLHVPTNRSLDQTL